MKEVTISIEDALSSKDPEIRSAGLSWVAERVCSALAQNWPPHVDIKETETFVIFFDKKAHGSSCTARREEAHRVAAMLRACAAEIERESLIRPGFPGGENHQA